MSARGSAALFVAGALFGAAGCSTSKAPPPVGELSPADETQAQALAHFAQGLVFEWQEKPDPEAALDAYKAAARLDPSDPDLRHVAARLLLDLSRPEEALALLEEAARELPESFDVQQALARVALHRGRFETAATAFLAAFELAEEADERRDMLRMGAFALFRLERDAEALSAISRLAALPSGRTDADAPPEDGADAAGTSREEAVRAALELAEMRMAEQTNATSSATYAGWAAQQAATDQARADVWESFAAAALRQRSPLLAADAFRRTAALDPLRTRAVVAATALEAGIPSRQVSLETLLAELRKGPATPALSFAAARFLTDAGRHADSLRHAAAAVESWSAAHPGKPRPPGIWLFQGSLLERAGKLEESERVFRKALAQHPHDAPIQNYLAYMLAEQSRELAEAERLVRGALEQDPDNSAYLDTLGWVYFRMDRYGDALIWLLRAAEGEPKDSVIFDHLGDTLDRLGRSAEADAYWAMSLHLDPDQEKVRAKLRDKGVDH